jgi:hypothetical protein
MITETLISITDLRTKTKAISQKIKKYGRGIVVANNKPLFVIISPEQRDQFQEHKNHFTLESLPSLVEDGMMKTQ